MDLSDPYCRLLLSSEVSTANNTVWGMPMWLATVLIVILLFISGLYSASENAFSNCNRYQFQTKANKGSKTAKIITIMIDRFDNTLITILVGNNIIQTLMSFISAVLFLNICKNYGLEGYEAIFSTVVMGILVYLVSDTLPKILSKNLPNKMSVILAWPIFFTEIILFPIIYIFRLVLKAVHRVFHIKEDNMFYKDELIDSVKEAINDDEVVEGEDDDKKEKLFDQNEEKIIDKIFDFDKKKVNAVFTPKEKVFSIDIDNVTIEQLNKMIVKSPYSRIPVYTEDKDDIIGVLVLKKYMIEYVQDKHLNVMSILEDTVDIDYNEEIDDAFEKLNQNKVHLGIVKKDGVYVGIISMQDILEELVEDIEEHTPNKEVKA